MPKEVYVAPARWKNFKIQPVKVYDIKGDYDNVRHMCIERIFRCIQHFSTTHILSNHFTYLNSLTIWTFSIISVKISHITCLSGTGSVPVFRLASFETNVVA